MVDLAMCCKLWTDSCASVVVVMRTRRAVGQWHVPRCLTVAAEELTQCPCTAPHPRYTRLGPQPFLPVMPPSLQWALWGDGEWKEQLGFISDWDLLLMPLLAGLKSKLMHITAKLMRSQDVLYWVYLTNTVWSVYLVMLPKQLFMACCIVL